MDEITKAVCQQVERELTKAFNKGKSKSTELTGYSGNNMSSWTHVSNVWDSNSNVPASYGFNIIAGNTESRLDFIPTKVIYSCPATICFFPDGSKVIVKCGKHEEYDKEAGVMACITKKIFQSRNAFKRLVKSGYENEDAVFERIAHNGQLKRQK